ncbi:hypothetical protein DL96DRAFT_168784 [Flagelloscypha sp. PMI_526]|nr:hypothetical protein DL96DRAFT_168784 [Flagelloscypha sp. PMI_526]
MASPLNQDLLRLIFSYIFDVETLHHLLFSFSIDSTGFILALQRRLQFPILLTVGSPAYTSKLYNILCSHPETTIFVQNFIFAGGPSPDTLDRGSQLMLSEEQSKALDELRPAYPLDLSDESGVDWVQVALARIFAAQKLSLGLPKLFGMTSSLRHLTWKLWPPPSTAVLDSMAGLSNLTSLSLECASSNWLTKHFNWLDTQERKNQDLDIEYLLKSIGFQLQHLDLRQVDETAYKQLILNFHHLTALIDLSIDINCSWDWDGGGSPQPGVSNKYQFEKIEFVSDIQHVSIDTSDLALGSLTGGPLKMLEGSSLSRLTVRFKSWSVSTSALPLHLTLSPH